MSDNPYAVDDDPYAYEASSAEQTSGAFSGLSVSQRNNHLGGDHGGLPPKQVFGNGLARGAGTAPPPEFVGYFQVADRNSDSVISGEEARLFFQVCNLPSATLAKIWAVADHLNQGTLGFNEFCDALYLVAFAQAGVEPKTSLLTQGGELPLPSLPPLSSWEEGEDGELEFKRQNQDVSVELQRAIEGGSQVASAIQKLKELYNQTVLPLEKEYRFDLFHMPLMRDSDFEAKPSIVLLGQYSVGKTTFIRYLLGREYPSAQIGPEPTTDRFVAIMHGQEDTVIPGNTLAVQKHRPFNGLQTFGSAFLNKLAGSECDSDLLNHVTLIDTPGVLAGNKQSLDRQYDFCGVVEWFSRRADLIMLLFDSHKLDISDEFRRVINAACAGNDDKVRVVLNKADQVNTQQLMRVYGALMWGMSRVVKSPEVPKVYIGNFSDHPYVNEENVHLLDKERDHLLTDLYDVPRRSLTRKVNEFVKRVRACKIHTLIMAHIREKMPTFSKEAKVKKIAANLPQVFKDVAAKHNLPLNDFPPASRFHEKLEQSKPWKLPRLDMKSIEALETLLEDDLPKVLLEFGNPFEKQ